MFLLWHPWLTTTNLSYSFPLLETSATASCGSTGTTKYYSSTTPYYKVLLRYYSVQQTTPPVLQSTTPVLFCTTQYCSSTTPALLCTTKYYSSTILCTTKYYSGIIPCYYKERTCKARSTNVTNVTKCCACHAKWLSWLILVTYATSFTMRRATALILQRHQILHLPRKMTLMSDVRHIWNVIYNARSNRTPPPTSPSTVPATQNDSHEWCPSHLKRHLQCAEQQDSSSNVTKYCTCHAKSLSWVMSVTYETSFTMRGATGITLQPHQILRLPRKIAFQNLRKICRKQLKRHFQCAADSTMIRTWSDYEIAKLNPSVCRVGNAFCIENYNISRSGYLPRFHQMVRLPRKVTLQDHQMLRLPRKMTHEWCPSHMKCHLQCAEQQDSPSNVTKYCACHAKWLSWVMSVTFETSFTMPGATGLILQRHQRLYLPRKMTLMSDVRHIWNVIYNARSNRHHPPTSPNIAPATQNCIPKSKKNLPKTVEASFPMRGRFDHDPTMKLQNWTRPFAELTFPPLGNAWQRILYWKLQRFALRLSTQISANAAPATKSDTPRSPNAAPATQNDSHDWCPSHMKPHLQCAEQQYSPSNVSKYSACHAKWLSWVMSVTYETSFTMRGATGLILQRHQILHLPRKMTFISDVRQIWNVIYNARSNRHHPPTSPNIAPATQKCIPKSKKNLPKTVEASIPMRDRSEHDPTMNSSSRTRPFAEVTFRASETHFVLKITTFRAPAIYPVFTEYCACHEKWHSNITECCACHEKWHSDITKYCACHEKWHSNITKYCACHEKWHSDITKYCACHEKWHSDITKYCACHAKWLSWLMSVAFETSFTMRRPPGITLQPHQILRLTELSCYWPEVSLRAVTELLLNWAVTELLLNWAVTEMLLYELLLKCYCTELLLNWAVTDRRCYEVLLSCYWT